MIRITAITILALAIIGCESDPDRISNMRARQDAALQNPFDYSPHGNSDISGGGLLDFDKNGFSHDANTVFNP